MSETTPRTIEGASIDNPITVSAGGDFRSLLRDGISKIDVYGLPTVYLDFNDKTYSISKTESGMEIKSLAPEDAGMMDGDSITSLLNDALTAHIEFRKQLDEIGKMSDK